MKIEQNRVGERIVIYKGAAMATAKKRVACIVKVVRQTKTLLICTRVSGVYGDPTPRISSHHEPNTPDELRAAEDEIEVELERLRKARIATEAREKDPRYQMLRNIQNSDTLWEKLSNEQLKIVCDILDTISAVKQ